MAGQVVERVSERELLVRRSFAAGAGPLFRAWTDPAVMMGWWVPKSFGITVLSAEMDVRLGGGYRFVFAHPAADQPMAFFGRYTEVVPEARLVWTNDESADGPVTTLTFAETDGRTEVVLHEVYPSGAALEEALESGSTGAYGEQFAALDALLPTLGG